MSVLLLDVQEEDRAKILGKTPSGGSSQLVGRPLTEVERYYSEQALSLTQGNREEAAKMLGIGERTLYRNIQEWKLQDKVRDTVTACNGNIADAAKQLNLKEAELQRKLKRWGIEAAK